MIILELNDTIIDEDGEFMKDYKKIIPNALTLTRIILTPVIIVLGLLGMMKIVIVLAIICALTDLVDGKLARKWNTVSNKGAKLDAVADKIFAIGLTACLIRNINILILPLVLEIIIGGANLFYYFKLNRTESLMIGKIKTTTLFISIIISMISLFFVKIDFLASGFIYATVNLQFLCLIFYFLRYLEVKNVKETTVENNINHQKVIYDVEEDIEKTKEISDLVELAEKYNLYNEEDFK